MPRISTCLVVGVTALLLVSGAKLHLSAARQSAAPSIALAAATPASIKAILQKIYSAQDAAAARKDIPAMFSTFAPGFVNTDIRGNAAPLQDFKEGLTHLARIAKTMKVRTAVNSARQNGATAIAVIKQTYAMVLVNPQDGKTATIGSVSVCRDTWKKTAAGWREIASHTLTETDTLNGKPTDFSKPSPSAPAGSI